MLVAVEAAELGEIFLRELSAYAFRPDVNAEGMAGGFGIDRRRLLQARRLRICRLVILHQDTVQWGRVWPEAMCNSSKYPHPECKQCMAARRRPYLRIIRQLLRRLNLLQIASAREENEASVTALPLPVATLHRPDVVLRPRHRGVTSD